MDLFTKAEWTFKMQRLNLAQIIQTTNVKVHINFYKINILYKEQLNYKVDLRYYLHLSTRLETL